MNETILFLLGSAGATLIISISKLFEPIRTRFNRPNPVFRFIYSLLTCPMCLGIWIGMGMYLIRGSVAYELIAYPCSTSMAAYLIYKFK